jgi:signal transduction histidine kinase
MRRKLTIYTLGLVLLVAGSLSLTTFYLEQARLTHTVEKRAEYLLAALTELLATSLHRTDMQGVRLHLASARTHPDVAETYVLDLEGRVLSDGTRANPMFYRTLDREFPRDLMESRAVGWTKRFIQDRFHIGGPVTLPDGQALGYLYVVISLEYHRQNVLENLRVQAIATILLVAIAAGLAVAFALWFSRPILHLADAARRIGRGDLLTPVSLARRDELGTLAFALNDMSARLKMKMTELEETQNNLEFALQSAQVASHAKSVFLANMSHELRTPLNAIIGFSEVMHDQVFGPIGSEQYLAYARDIHTAGTHLLGVINDVLDLSKVEAGKMEIVEEPVDMVKVIDDAVRWIDAHRIQAQVVLEKHIRPDLPRVAGDQRKITQTLCNLLSNAVKFTQPGGRVDVRAYVDAVGRLVLQVADTGVGMTVEGINKALTPFGQIENVLARNHQGTGLGLPLARSLVELHGGTLTVESEVGLGTTVTAVFPANRVMRAAA